MRYGKIVGYGYAGLMVLTLMLVACGPGGGNSADVFPWNEQPAAAITGPNSFLLFPNPQKQDDDSLQTDTIAYATAYYEAIDPNDDKDTLTKWKAANGFDGVTGTQTWVVFGDVKDLGYGRRMTARQNLDGPLGTPGTVAVMVENYLVTPAANYIYSSLNLDAAVVRDTRWHVGTNGIEYTPPPGMAATADCGNCFPKFFTFNPTTGQRLLEADLDGRGDKAMPGICISCHGGRADPLKADGSFPRSVTSFPGTSDVAALAGDVQARLQPLEVDAFDFSATPGYTRADQEAKLRAINQMVLCTYPLPTGTVKPTGFAEDVCRRVAGPNEWQGTAAEMIKDWYGGNITSPTAVFADTYVPQPDGIFGAGWAAATNQQALYEDVIAKSCRVCHILRGTANMDEINFRSYCVDSGIGGACELTLPGYFFLGYTDRIKAHVIDRGNMPLGKLIYQKFWNSTQPDLLAAFLDSQGQEVYGAASAVLVPGRPIADPGPDRTTDSPAKLPVANSLYATTYEWSIVSGASGVLSYATGTLSDAAEPLTMPTLAGQSGTPYELQLVVGNGTTLSEPVQVNVTIATVGSLALPIAASAIRFSDIKAILQGTLPQGDLQYCTSCHTLANPQTSFAPPIFYTNYDRDGIGGVTAADDDWFYNDLRGRINFTDVAASPLLLKPTGYHHNGGLIFDTASLITCVAGFPTCLPYATYGDYYKAQYNKIVLWILNGAPQN